MNNFTLYGEDELLEMLSEGNHKAFKELYNRYWRSLLNHAAGTLQSQSEGEEIVQEIFVDLWNKREGLQIRNLPSYLHTLVRNRCISFIRSKAVERKYQEYYKNLLYKRQQAMVNNSTFTEAQKAFEEELQKLPEKTQMIFKLSNYDGLSVEEIAKQFHCSKKAVEYHLTKSKSFLKAGLRGDMLRE